MMPVVKAEILEFPLVQIQLRRVADSKLKLIPPRIKAFRGDESATGTTNVGDTGIPILPH